MKNLKFNDKISLQAVLLFYILNQLKIQGLKNQDVQKFLHQGKLFKISLISTDFSMFDQHFIYTFLAFAMVLRNGFGPQQYRQFHKDKYSLEFGPSWEESWDDVCAKNDAL